MRGLRPAAVVGADVVEVSPAYDHAEITAIAAAHVLYDLVTLMAAPPTGLTPSGHAGLGRRVSRPSCNSAFTYGKPTANVASVG